MGDVRPYPSDPRYGVTRDGRVFRIERARFGRSVPFEMRLRSDRDGYLLVGGGADTRKVHRMVAETFIPNPQDYPEVRHKDGVRSRNTVDNLEWGTREDNVRDMVRHGTKPLGTRHGNAKLSDEEVRDARRRAADGETHASISAGASVDRSVLSRAIRGATWNHV